MTDEFIPGPGGVAAFDQQHAAALQELRGARAFMLVIAEPSEGEDGEMQTRVYAGAKSSPMLAAACAIRSVEHGTETLQAMHDEYGDPEVAN